LVEKGCPRIESLPIFTEQEYTEKGGIVHCKVMEKGVGCKAVAPRHTGVNTMLYRVFLAVLALFAVFAAPVPVPKVKKVEAGKGMVGVYACVWGEFDKMPMRFQADGGYEYDMGEGWLYQGNWTLGKDGVLRVEEYSLKGGKWYKWESNVVFETKGKKYGEASGDWGNVEWSIVPEE
jgi:hypothetical protein